MNRVAPERRLKASRLAISELGGRHGRLAPRTLASTGRGRAMIGMIALSGIATRNSILLIEFVEQRKAEGHPLVRSLLEAGALRTRPILLTSLAAMLAAWPITLDPIFSGLAWALIFGITVSTFFTLMVVPMVYYMAYGKKEQTRKQ